MFSNYCYVFFGNFSSLPLCNRAYIYLISYICFDFLFLIIAESPPPKTFKNLLEVFLILLLLFCLQTRDRFIYRKKRRVNYSSLYNMESNVLLEYHQPYLFKNINEYSHSKHKNKKRQNHNIFFENSSR